MGLQGTSWVVVCVFGEGVGTGESLLVPKHVCNFLPQYKPTLASPFSTVVSGWQGAPDPRGLGRLSQLYMGGEMPWTILLFASGESETCPWGKDPAALRSRKYSGAALSSR